MNTIQEIEQEQVAKLTEKKSIPNFSPGDTVTVSYTHLTLPTNREV